ncbi:MAG: O-antigen ligase family protein [Actinomycetota bacterium]
MPKAPALATVQAPSPPSSPAVAPGRSLPLGTLALDGVGAALLAAAILWTFASSGSPGDAPGPVAALYAASVAALIAGRLVGSVARWAVPALVTIAAASLLLLSPLALSRAPLAGPFGYANAAGAFFVQAAGASLMLASVTRATPARALGVAAAIAFAAIPFIRGSLAAATLVVVLPLGLVLTRGVRAVRLVVAACASIFLLALIVTILLGVAYAGGPRAGELDRLVDRTLSERRVALWHDALVIMREDPVTGVGPGGFELASPTALDDRDARWAHNEFLQQGAEGGLPGFALLSLLFLWGFARLWSSRSPDAATALGAVALAALGIHASIDYVLHFPAIPIVAAALLGAAQASRGSDAAPIREETR